MFVDLAPPGRAVPWSYATSSPQYADSPFYVAEANACVERGTAASIALLFWRLHPAALVLVALLLAATHVACQRLRSRGYKRVPCDLTSSYNGHYYA